MDAHFITPYLFTVITLAMIKRFPWNASFKTSANTIAYYTMLQEWAFQCFWGKRLVCLCQLVWLLNPIKKKVMFKIISKLVLHWPVHLWVNLRLNYMQICIISLFRVVRAKKVLLYLHTLRPFLLSPLKFWTIEICWFHIFLSQYRLWWTKFENDYSNCQP